MFGGGKTKGDQESESYLESYDGSHEEGTGEEYEEGGEETTTAAEDYLDKLTGNELKNSRV